MNKAIIILVDGMRPDGMVKSGSKYLEKLTEHAAYTMSATTVMPSVTLPCHMSLFHSVPPERHGITTNTFMPQVRPVKGLGEVLKAAGKKNAFFYNWEQLKDLTRPDSLSDACYVSGHTYGYEEANRRLTENCVKYIKEENPDFVFLYLGWTDEAGHAEGWMGKEYLRSIDESLKCIEKVENALSDDYLMIVTADHGGHGRSHGTDMPEDMTIPMFLYNRKLASKQIKDANIVDIAPTVVKLLGAQPEPEWEGKAIDFE